MPLADFSVVLEPDGHGKVIVNDEDVSRHVVAGQVSFARNEIPRLTLRLLGDGHIEGQGVVEVQPDPNSGDTRPIGQIVADWLAEQDPMQVWSLALEGGALSDHPAPAIFRYLADLARQELGT